MPDQSSSEKFFTVTEAAREIGVHPNTLRNWDRQGLFVPERVGGRRLYTSSLVARAKDLAHGQPVAQRGLGHDS